MKKNYGYWRVYYQCTPLNDKARDRIGDACMDWVEKHKLCATGMFGDYPGDIFIYDFQVWSAQKGIRAPKWKARLLMSEIHRLVCARGRCIEAKVTMYPERDEDW